ncbi:MAG: isoprenylcysteine carboxylmethyltransferase family protein [Kiritimatiellia bacterium]
MKTRYEKFRLPLSRAATAAAVLVLVFSTSHWDENDPMVSTCLFFIGMVLVAVGSLGRMWCSVYIAGYKDRTLITQGPYSICRNPLYFFSTFGALGIGFCTETFTFPLAVLVVMILYYPLVVRKEERRLREYFGSDMDDYLKRVPAFFPKFSLFSEPETYTVKPAAYRRHMFSALWFVWIVGLIELAEGLKEIGWIKSFGSIY